MTGRLRICGQSMGSYVRSPLPLHRPLCPLRRVPFCCSRGHVYIFVRFVIDIPDLLFTLLSYFRIIRLSCDILGLICSGRYHPNPRYFSPRDEPRGVNERPAIARENEITFIVNISSRKYQHRPESLSTGAVNGDNGGGGGGGGGGGVSCCQDVPQPLCQTVNEVGYPDRA